MGIALFVVGLVFRFGGDALKEDIKPAFENININNYDLYTLISSLAIIFIVAGAVVILFSFIGFIGAACFVKGALILVSIHAFNQSSTQRSPLTSRIKRERERVRARESARARAREREREREQARETESERERLID